MTEAEWLACTDPALMLKFIQSSYQTLSARKLRLFAVACCRSIISGQTEREVREAVDTLEQFAEGKVSEWQLRKACSGAQAVWVFAFGCDYVSAAVYEATRLAANHPFDAATAAALVAAEAAACRAGRGTKAAELQAQCDWLRDVFPSPFRPKFVQRSWSLWNGRTVPKLAQAIYEDWAFDRLAILGDALEEACCTNADILSHCRSAGPHVRGCWVIDLLLGKQ
jgi:hypothetical protein